MCAPSLREVRHGTRSERLQADFPKVVRAGLVEAGFLREGARSCRYEAPDVWVLVAPQSAYAAQWYVNVGFQLRGFGKPRELRVHHTDLYFRLERLFPQHSEVILAAGARDDADPRRALEQLAALLPSIADGLQLLASEETLGHALRNAAVPLVTVIALSYAGLLEGSVLTETVFSWPGLGLYITNSLQNADMNAVLGGTIVVGSIFIGINLLSDLAYRMLDPRTRPR